MIIGSISENKNLEKRVAIVPDIIKKYINLGFEVQILKGYGDHLGFSDESFHNFGAKIISTKDEVLKSSNVLIQLDLIEENGFTLLNKETSLIGSFNSSQNVQKIEKF